jgi:maltose alpha-D-glucosyltransferase/alpha-amylase
MRLAFSLLLTLPGTPVIPYGDEIGLGDDLSRPEREAVRPAMQWSAGPAGGFSLAAPERIAVPLIAGGPFAPEWVNAKDQNVDPTSLLSWVRRAIAVRKEHPAFGRGTFVSIDTGERAVLAHRCAWEGGDVIAVHNLGATACTVDIPFGDGERIFELLGDAWVQREPDRLRVDLDGHGIRWFGVHGS